MGTAVPGGLPERSKGTVCKTVAKATLVRTQHPPHPAETAPDQHVRVSGARLHGLTVSHGIPLSLTVRGRIGGKIVGPAVPARALDGGPVAGVQTRSTAAMGGSVP